MSELKRRAVIVDVDGTLCDVRPIRHLIKEEGFDAFHLASAGCQPNQWVINEVKEAFADGYTVIIMTGRMEKYRELTTLWLQRHRVPFNELHCRPNGDFRKDAVVKAEILASLREWCVVERAWDDNPTVVSLWVSEGIPTVVVPGWE